LRPLDFCGSCNHAACDVEREFDAGARASKVAALHYQRGAEKSKKLVGDFREWLDNLVTSRQEEASHITAAGTATLNLQAALNNPTNGRAQEKERVQASLALMQGPATTP
jgi:hypothetical protein